MTDILRLSLPLTLWLVGFSSVYALQGLACSRHWPEALDARAALIAASVAAAVIQSFALLAVRSLRSESVFAQRVATALALTALVATIWTVLPVVAISVCSS